MHSNPNQTLPTRVIGHVPVGSQVTITIGRNDGDRPMRRADWDLFQAVVRNAVRDLFHPSMTFGPFRGDGEWNGTTEESSVLIVITTYPASVEAVASRLADIAAEFDQDAIAWSHGPNLLASGAPSVGGHHIGIGGH